MPYHKKCGHESDIMRITTSHLDSGKTKFRGTIFDWIAIMPWEEWMIAPDPPAIVPPLVDDV